MLPWKYPGLLLRAIYPEAIFRGDPAGGRIYLTFDDGPHPEVTPRLLDVLRNAKARATFFVIHNRTAWWGEILREAASEGHAIALHGLQHRGAYLKSNQALHGELLELEGHLRDLDILPGRLFRPPFGHVRPDSVVYLRRRGIQTVLWTTIPGDYRPAAPLTLFHRAVRELAPGSILALHDGTNLSPAPVLELTRMLLDYISQQGWQAAPLDTALRPEVRE
ncbi:MAG TPA: polysaccharide deacetylase family protein [bacterium]|jgi:peptidoglycan/xylan/chitin deacetylase (PgdA/CDA1 family)